MGSGDRGIFTGIIRPACRTLLIASRRYCGKIFPGRDGSRDPSPGGRPPFFFRALYQEISVTCRYTEREIGAAAFPESDTEACVARAKTVVGVSIAWIVPLFLGATLFPGNVRAETLRISGTGGASGGIRGAIAGKFLRFVRSPKGKAVLSRVGHAPLP